MTQNTQQFDGTTVIGILKDGHAVIGADGQVTFNATVLKKNARKVRKLYNNSVEWRTDKYLRRLEAMLIAMNKEKMFLISGTGDIVEPDDNVIAIGSGGPYAYAAAQALLKYSSLSAREIVEQSLHIAADLCIYTNAALTIEEL